MDIKIIPLESCLHFLDTIAQYATSEFGFTKEFYVKNFKEAQTFVALYEDKLAGFVCIDKNDSCHEKYKQKNNWIADLYVLEPFRSRGIANKLIEYVLQENGNKKLYLWTEHNYLLSFFSKKGFQIKDILEVKNHLVFFMLKKPNAFVS